MSFPSIQTALNAGELSPSLYGRVDLAKYKSGCSTQRNFFASYRGGANSRAGTAFVGFCKQGNQGTANLVAPPRNITYQYSATQGITIEAGDNYFRFISNGAYITETPIAITGITNANPGVIAAPGHDFINGDEVFLAGIVGTISNRLSARSFLVANVVASTSFTLVNPLTGAAINTTSFGAYTSAGTAARIYTLPTPYAAADLPYMKVAQSADVMTITVVNTASRTEYPPYDLARITSAQWTLTETTFIAGINSPASITASVSDSGISTPSFYYQFCMTAVDATTGEESQASPVTTLLSVDISSEAATITISGASVANAGSYNFYGAPESYETIPSAGAFFGYLGSNFGPSFTDTNIIADFTTAPPLHRNPFAQSAVLAVPMTNQGSGYNQLTTTAAVGSPTGDSAILTPVVINGGIAWIVVSYAGSGYTSAETVTIIDSSGDGAGAAAGLTIGPATGTYPSCVAYFQQRRFYASTLNSPDTYFASQPGAFTNMDVSMPSVDSDAIIGSPWSQQVNGIQWMLNMPGGLVIFTGSGAWQLSGNGGGLATSAAITPANQVANPQAYNGCSPTVPPIPINYDILYVQEKGSIVRDLSYNFFVNIYTGTDMTVLSNHLFDGYQVVQWAWAEEPNKLIWVVRSDGALLCQTYLKEQDVYAWTRHDTQGLYQSVCSVSEPPVNAPYFIAKRLIQNDGNPVWAYFQERMDNRLWNNQESAWCVDAGLAYPQTTPNATLTVSSASGVPTLSQPVLVFGGANYSAGTYAAIIDPTGAGAVASVVVTAGVVTAVSVSGNLTGYTAPQIGVIDPTGAGGNAAVSIVSNAMTVITATSPVFANVAGQGEVGDVIRMGGRVMGITKFLSSTSLEAVVLRNAQPGIPDDPNDTPTPAPAGQWTIAAPVSTVYGLDHLEGMLVSILADGVVVEPQTVVNGTITLPEPATAIVVGLGFTAQLQTLYLDVATGPATVQGRRKEIDSVVARVVASGLPFSVGTNQPDAATQTGQVPVPWQNMTAVAEPPPTIQPIQPYDFVSGDLFVPVSDVLGVTGGQVALQQSAPLPLNVLALVVFSRIHDDPDQG